MTCKIQPGQVGNSQLPAGGLEPLIALHTPSDFEKRLDERTKKKMACRDRRRFVLLLEKGLPNPHRGEGMATLEDLDTRVRILESEVTGEKAVTRSVYEQFVRNGDVLNALRGEVATGRVDITALASQVDHVVQEVVQNTAALRNHGTLLTLLQQDVGALRSDATELRRGQEAISVRLDQLESNIAARFDQLESNVAAILAAVTPRDLHDARRH